MQTKMKLLNTLIIVIIIMLTGNCYSAMTITGSVTVDSDRKIILTLGDSITASEAVGAGESRYYGYRLYLYPLLDNYWFVGPYNTASANYGTYGNNGGHSGDTAADLETRIADNLRYIPVANPDLRTIVIIHIGTNDANSNYTESGSEANSVQNVIDIIDAVYAANSGAEIYACLIVPNAAEGAEDTRITSFNTALLTAIGIEQAAFPAMKLYEVDLNTSAGGGMKANADWATTYFTAGDDIHPNATGYQFMGEKIATEILSH